MAQNPIHYTDQEWFSMIQDCKASSLTTKDWCEQHGITSKALYYHTRKLRQKGYDIPQKAAAASRPEKQEAFCINLASDSLFDTKVRPGDADGAAIRINFHGVFVEVSNQAAQETIANTFLALQGLC